MKRFLLLLPLLLSLLTPAFASSVTMRNANLTTSATDTLVSTSNVFTAPRVLTIPGSGGLNGSAIRFIDTVNAVSSTNTLTIQSADGTNINGASTLVINSAGTNIQIFPSPLGWYASVTTSSSGVISSGVLLAVGSGNYTVPNGVYHLSGVMCAGGGGGGGTAVGAAATGTSGQSGGLVTFEMDVTPSQVIAYVVGAKGTGVISAAGNPGADSTFGTLIAKGGIGGAFSSSGNAAAAATTTILNTQAIQQTIIPTAALYLTANVLSAATAGTAGTGGVNRSNGYGVPGAGGTSANGADGTGYCQSGGGAGNIASTALAGGNGSDGVILLSY